MISGLHVHSFPTISLAVFGCQHEHEWEWGTREEHDRDGEVELFALVSHVCLPYSGYFTHVLLSYPCSVGEENRNAIARR